MVFSLINNPSEMPHIFIASYFCAYFLLPRTVVPQEYLTNKYFAFLQYPVGYTGWPSIFSGHEEDQGEKPKKGGDHMRPSWRRAPQQFVDDIKLLHISNLNSNI